MSYTFTNKSLINKQLTKLSVMILIILSHSQGYSQTENGTITGTVKDSTGAPLSHISVALKGINKGTYTDSKGNFTLNKIPFGIQTLVFQMMGFTTIERQVEVTSEEPVILSNITLKEDLKTLSDVDLDINRNKFAKKESDYVARLPLKNVENPQVYNVVSKQLIQEQVVVNFDDAVKNAPGISRLWTSTGRASDGAGYFSIRGFSVQPTMINGISGLTNGGIDPANTEAIEVVKGPSGTLFGSSLISFGGLINIITKKPYEGFGGEVSLTGGSFGLSRIAADVNTSLNKNNTALFRINTAYHYEGSFQDAGFKKSIFIAPSFAYKANERLSFFANVEYYNSEATNPLMVFLNRTRKLIAKNPDELGLDFKRSFTSNDITIKNPTLNMYGQIVYKLSNHWVSQTNLSRSVRNSDGYYSYVMFRGPADDTLTRFLTDQKATTITTGIQQNFIGDFKIAGMRNRVVVGLDFLNIYAHNNNTAYITFDQFNALNVNDPKYGQLTKAALDAKLAVNNTAATTPTKNGSNSSNYSVYFSDVLNITDNLLAMASLRLDHFDNLGTRDYRTVVLAKNSKYYQTSLSPKFGLVYQVVKDKVSVFTNYMNGFKNVAPVTQPLSDISGTFKPQHANQFEGGVKLEVFNKKLNLVASYYDIQVTNMTRSEILERNGTAYNITVQDGTQKSKGIEFDIIANPIPGLNIIAGYSYNDSKLVKGDVNLEGRRPTSAGPEHLANTWISYTLTRGKVKGFGLGIGGNYASENKITNSKLMGEFTLPSYVVFNSSIFYDAAKYRLALKVDNLTDEVYYGGWSTVERQLPRRLMANLIVRF